MSDYVGHKSLDAEVTIDFLNNILEMDYSFNDKGNPYSSNTTTVLKDDLKELEKTNKKEAYRLKIKHSFYGLYFSLYEVTVSPIITCLTERGWVKNKVWLIEHQKINRMLSLNSRGKVIIKKEGPLFENMLIIHLNNNMWLRYSLEGKYKQEISSIILKRNFIKIFYDNKYEKIKQDGWNLIFTFKNPPKSGSVTIEST